MIAFALARHRFRGRTATNLTIFLPMATPEVVLGASLLALFLNLQINLGFNTIVIAHVMFCISFVVVTVKARIAGLDPRLEQAAMDLYADEWQTFRRITLPLVAPGIAAGALLAFSLSFDDFIITNFNSGVGEHLPEVRLGVVPARHPGAGQRDRLGDVLPRPDRRAARPGRHRRPEAAEGLIVTSSAVAAAAAALVDVRHTPYWLDGPAPDAVPGACRCRDRRPGGRRRRLHRALDRAAGQGARARTGTSCSSRAAPSAGRRPGATAGSARPA